MYRLFTNDRKPLKGTPMYSAYKDVRASNAEEARKHCPPQFDAPYYAPSVAIPLLDDDRSDGDRAWLRKHVLRGSFVC